MSYPWKVNSNECITNQTQTKILKLKNEPKPKREPKPKLIWSDLIWSGFIPTISVLLVLLRSTRVSSTRETTFIFVSDAFDTSPEFLSWQTVNSIKGNSLPRSGWPLVLVFLLSEMVANHRQRLFLAREALLSFYLKFVLIIECKQRRASERPIDSL